MWLAVGFCGWTCVFVNVMSFSDGVMGATVVLLGVSRDAQQNHYRTHHAIKNPVNTHTHNHMNTTKNTHTHTTP